MNAHSLRGPLIDVLHIKTYEQTQTECLLNIWLTLYNLQ